MDYTQLRGQLAGIQERGFDDSFIDFCAKTFSSHTYPQENLAAARMHAHYLRVAMEEIVCTENEGDLYEEAPDADRIDRVFDAVLRESIKAALESDRPFIQCFVEMWCEMWSQKHDVSNSKSVQDRTDRQAK